MLGKIIGIGEVKRKPVKIEALSYNFDVRFKESMSWIDEDIEILSMTPIKIVNNGDMRLEEYLIIYRELERSCKALHN